MGVVDLERAGLPVVVLGLRGPAQPAEATRAISAARRSRGNHRRWSWAARRAGPYRWRSKSAAARPIGSNRVANQPPGRAASPRPGPTGRSGPIASGMLGGRSGRSRGGLAAVGFVAVALIINMLTARPKIDNRRDAGRPAGAHPADDGTTDSSRSRRPCPVNPRGDCLPCHMPRVKDAVPRAVFTDH